MIRIYLIRHGQTLWNIERRFQGQSDVELSEEGIHQAEQLAENFPAEKLDAIYASDLKRAMRTAETVAEKFHLPVVKEESFRELGFGAWEGKKFDEITARWPQALEDFFHRPDSVEIPDGESFEHLQSRAVKALQEILFKRGKEGQGENEGKSIAIFAHGAVNRALLASFLGMPLYAVWRISQMNTAVNVIRFDDGFPTVELVNSTDHLI